MARNAILASGLAGLAGGAIGVLDLRYAYGLSALAASTGLALVLSMSEPRSHERQVAVAGPLEQLRTCGRLLRHPVLAWVFGFYVVMTVLNHVPYEFYQPWLPAAAPGDAWRGLSTRLLPSGAFGLAALLALAATRRAVSMASGPAGNRSAPEG